MHASSLVLAAVAAAAFAAWPRADASPSNEHDHGAAYSVSKVLVAKDEYKGEPGLVPAPIYKPHDARTTKAPDFWVTSNERTGCAGITVLKNGTDSPLSNVIIDEPGVAYSASDAELGAGGPCVGSVSGTEPAEGTVVNFAPDVRMNPKVCLPVVLPPGAAIPVWKGVAARKGPFPNTICAPLGAEEHPRHPHGIVYDYDRKRAYQVIEHAGLRWNSTRTAFVVAETTDEESGLTLTWDLSDPDHPKIGKAYLNGHGAHEITVNQRTGVVYQGNHEQSPGVYLTRQAAANNQGGIWVDVIYPDWANPYRFIDTGYFNAIQGLDYVRGATADQDVIYGVTHVGEKLFAFNASCVPANNASGITPPPAPSGYSLPAGDTGMKSGWNCIKYWVNLRPAFDEQVANAAAILQTGVAQGAPANVLHFHNVAANPVTGTTYSTLHSIHDAEHTGLDDEAPLAAASEEEEPEHVMGRWVAAVDPATSVDDKTKQAVARVRIIDLSHGYSALVYPLASDILGKSGLDVLTNSFVHAHFVWVDPSRSTVLVTGEHTGNVGVIDEKAATLGQVIPVSRVITGCKITPEPDQPMTEAEEPHVHGVVIQPQTGTAYVSDEGEHCFYESETIMQPSW